MRRGCSSSSCRVCRSSRAICLSSSARAAGLPASEAGGCADSAADAPRRLDVQRQVYVVPRHPPQTLAQDRRHRLLAGPVIQRRRHPGRRLELQVDLDAVPLVGPDLPPVLAEGKALLVAARDDRHQIRPRDRHTLAGAGRQQRVDLDPSTRPQHEADARRIVAQVLAQELADTYEVAGHAAGSPIPPTRAP